MRFRLHIVALMTAVLFSLYSCKVEKVPDPPNIIVILADDLGYSDLGCFGGEIPTPNLDRLADNGLRMTQFYNSARCCPTRASLLTGLYPHQAGMGDMVEGRLLPDSSFLPAYQGYLSDHCVTLAEVLGRAGYHTMISGKWHVGDEPEHWPNRRGFDRQYTLIQGATNYFTLDPWIRADQQIQLMDGEKQVIPGEDFYLTREINRSAIRFLEERPKDRPFFLYLAHCAPHWPLHALPEDIDLFRGTYLKGWNEMRRKRFQKMLEQGILPPEAEISPRYQRDEFTPEWDTLSPRQKAVFDLRMAVHAAMIYRMDQGIGKILNRLEEEEELENTLILFLSDNGATSALIHLVDAWPVDRDGPTGSARSFDSQGPSWANASNTPLRLFKKYTHEGGINTPFIAYWPGVIKPGRIDHTPAHVMDILPTLSDICSAPYPDTFRTNRILPAEGISLDPLFHGNVIDTLRPLFFEHTGNRAVRKGAWKAVYQNRGKDAPPGKWELYHIGSDRNELNDLSDQYPFKTRELMELWQEWSERTGVEEDYNRLILAKHL